MRFALVPPDEIFWKTKLTVLYMNGWSDPHAGCRAGGMEKCEIWTAIANRRCVTLTGIGGYATRVS